MFRKLSLDVLSLWPPANFVDPETRGSELYVVTAVFLTIATLSLGARLYSRIWIRRYFGPDDGLLIFAYVRLSCSRNSCLV
jgi:hypothetical protein